MKKREISMTTKTLIVLSALLLVADVILSSVLLKRSNALMRTMINERMLDISKTAADMLDGDALKHLTVGEEDTAEYKSIYNALRLFQDNIDLEYIYTVRDMGNGAFTFLIDPAEENASEFGELVKVTPALKNASLGTSAVDAEAYEDSWGRFYSAYSPVYDTQGKVAGIVAVDFNAEWYDSQVTRYAGTVLISSVLSFCVGALIVVAVASRQRDHIRLLNAELSELKKEPGAKEKEHSPESETDVPAPEA